MHSPSTSLTPTCFQNLLFREGPLLLFELRNSFAVLSISACFLLLATRSWALWTAAVTGGSGGGPVPTIGATLADFATEE